MSKAVIMAGGEGTRLRPLTSNVPKPMVPLVNKPMMEHIVGLLKEHGFDEIVVTVAFLANQIRSYFGDGSDFGVRMVYATEETPLGTAGSVRNAMDELADERFLVISGDVLTDIDLAAIDQFHVERDAMATIGLVSVENPLEFGIVITQEDGSIERFLEKPTWGEVFSDNINTGIFVLEPEIFDYIPEGRPVDFSSEVFPKLLEDGKRLFGCVAEGYWEDVGTHEAYLSAHKDVLDRKVHVDIAGFEVGDSVWYGEGAEVSPDAVVDGPAVIGDHCRVEGGVHLGPYTVLGSNVRARTGTELDRVVIHDNAYLGEGVRLRGTVLGRSCDLRNHVHTEEGVVVGDECFIGDNASLAAGVKVYPFKTVEAGAVINSSIVWESKGARSLFGRTGVHGLANVDITPELATKLAMAYATTLEGGTTVITSRDSSLSARMLKRAVMAGLNAAGVNVLDLEVASVPVTRFAARHPDRVGAITIRLDEADDQSVTIRFFDGNGADLTEDAQRKIERRFAREDFRRVVPAEIGDIGFPPRALEYYTAALETTIDLDLVRGVGFKLVVDYSFGSTSFVMPNVFAKLNGDVLGVNPYASTVRLLGFDRERAVERVSDLVKASGAHLGTVFDPGGERMTVVDDRGEKVSRRDLMLVLLSLIGDHVVGDQVAIMVSETEHAARIIEAGGLQPYITKTSPAAMMDAATQPGVGFAVSSDGGAILPGFLPAYDAAAGLVKLLELLARAGKTMHEVVEELPDVFMVRDRVVTPWEQKGAVMRGLVELAKDRHVELIDGVKIHHEDGWVLALPDPEEPVTHLIAEANDTATARRLIDEYTRRIEQMQA